MGNFHGKKRVFARQLLSACRMDCRRPPQWLVISMAVPCVWCALGWVFSSTADLETARGSPILGPADFGFVSLTYERHSKLALERLIVEAQRVTATDDDVARALAFASKALSRNQPFTILYNMRQLSRPTLSRAQLGMGIEWAREHSHGLDSQLQCIALVLRSPVVRGLVHIVLRFLGPPQPIHVGKDEASAFRFARDHCGGRVRHWGAESKARDEKYGRSKWK